MNWSVKLPLKVEVHPDFLADFEEALGDSALTLDHVIRDFTICMETQGQRIPSYMGCDQPYHQPAAARAGNLRHIHIALPPQKFKKGTPQAYRRCSKDLPELDAALLYVRGLLDEDSYMILAFFAPRAHEKQRDNAIMTKLGWIAKDYRDAN